MQRNWFSVLKFHLLCLYKANLQVEKVESFIPGMYEGHYLQNGEYIKDVISIRRLSEVSVVFLIERQILRGSVELQGTTTSLAESEKWISALHTGTRQLLCDKLLRVFSFVPERFSLYFEEREYYKTAKLN
jgi:hypothetical protein